MNMKGKSAPGHVYVPSLGTGIEWQPNIVRLWEQGEVTQTAPHSTNSREEFFYQLAFREAFPDVSHWWFRSLWTGRASFSAPVPELSQGNTIGGWVSFESDPENRYPWSVENATTPVVDVPYPPMNVQPVNLPLRILMARIVVGLLEDDVVADRQYALTSLVRSEDLEKIFPENYDHWFGNWRLSNGAKPLSSAPRTALLELQGLAA